LLPNVLHKISQVIYPIIRLVGCETIMPLIKCGKQNIFQITMSFSNISLE
jgi:hypothetical protein